MGVESNSSAKKTLQKAGVLILKNLLLRKRQWFVTFFEVVFPLLCGGLVVFLVIPDKDKLRQPQQTFPFTQEELKKRESQWCSSSDAPFIAYAPSNDETDKVMKQVSVTMCSNKQRSSLTNVTMWNMSDASVLESEYRSGKWKMAVIFPDGLAQLKSGVTRGSKSTSKLAFTLRFPANWLPSTNHLFPQKGEPGYHLVGPDVSNWDTFLNSNVWIVQYHVESALSQQAAGGSRDDGPLVLFQPMPYPAYRTIQGGPVQGDGLSPDFMGVHVLGLIVMASTYFLLVSLTRNVLGEKTSGISELLRLSGVSVSLQWLSWLAYLLLPHLLVTIPGLTILLRGIHFLDNMPLLNTDTFLLIVTLFLFVFANCALGFLICGAARRPLIASTVAVLIVFGSTFFSLYYTLWMGFKTLDFGARVVGAIFFPNFALAAILVNYSLFPYIVVDDSDAGSRATWSNLWEWQLGAGENVSTGALMLILVADTLVWMALAVYLDGVLPSEHGTRKPWYFFDCFSTRGKRQGRVDPAENGVHEAAVSSAAADLVSEIEQGASPETAPSKTDDKSTSDRGGEMETKENLSPAKDQTNFERESETEVGVEVCNLYKKFGEKMAVDGVTLKLFTGDIFALLGHNGAGKTTLISLLTGFMPPTKGTALIAGHDISETLDKARESMGLCPQQNMLFDKLTVHEQLLIFGMLRGLSCAEARKETDTLLTAMNLSDKSTVLASKLSGGQKRKLQLGIALIGGTKVVVLDEPTSGMDPQARREMWDLLLALRGERRTILLTTHFMEEADVLGDRIGIMAAGKLQCVGTASFLKKLYGSGFTLKLTLTDERPASSVPDVTPSGSSSLKDIPPKSSAAALRPETSPSPRAMAMLTVVQRHVPNAALKGELRVAEKLEISVTLPADTATTSTLSKLLAALNSGQDKLGIQTIGLSQATMDEVFLRVGELTGKDPITLQQQEPDENKGGITTTSNEEGTPKVVGQGNLMAVQFRSLLEKKMRYALRHWLSFFFLMLLVVVLWTVTLVIITSVILKVHTLEGSSNYTGILSRSSSQGGEQRHKRLEMALGGEPFRSANPITLHNLSGSSGGESGWKGVQNVDKSLLSAANADRLDFKKRYLVAVEYLRKKGSSGRDLLVGKFNLHPYHVPFLALNLAFNVRSELLNHRFRTRLSLHPFPGDPSTKSGRGPRTAGGDTMTRSGELARPRDMQDTYYKQCLGNSRLYNYWFLVAYLVYTILPLGLFFFTSYLIAGPVQENLSKVKQLQTMTGVNPLVYWGAAFTFDLGLYLALVLLLLILLVVCDTAAGLYVFTANGGWALFPFILFVYGITAIPFVYLLSFRATSTTGGYTLALTLQFLGGLVLATMPDPPMTFRMRGALPVIVQLLRVVGRLFPSCVLCRAVWYWGKVSASNSRCHLLRGDQKEEVCPPVRPYWVWSTPRQVYRKGEYWGGYRDDGFLEKNSCGNYEDNPATDFEGAVELGTADEPGVAQELFFLILHGLVYVCLLLLIEFRLFSKLLGKLRANKAAEMFAAPVDDEDVLEETSRVEQLLRNGRVAEDAIVLHRLSKSFGNFAAVSGLQLGVHFGECFGLLGVNGAGKTTAFRMITGDEVPTAGTVYGFGTSLLENKRQFLSHVGYCPQFDALIPTFTGAEMLDLFAGLRGVPFPLRRQQAMLWLQRMGLEDSAHSKCGRYSGGMKRRLSTAMAMIGNDNPSLILLDEPTSGVDPVSRRQFWTILEQARASGQAIILTSHSMEECEALCARLCIMVNGQVQCFGSVEHLKHKFAQGYSLTLKLKPDLPFGSPETEDKISALEQRIAERFSPCQLKDKHQNLRQFHLQDPALRRDTLFQKMEEVRSEFEALIEEYSVDETSLEQVFLSFARMQYPERKVDKGRCKRICTCSC